MEGRYRGRSYDIRRSPSSEFIRHSCPSGEYAGPNGDVTLKYQDRRINAKDIMQIMTAGIKYGADLVVVCEGREETEALRAMISVIENGLGE